MDTNACSVVLRDRGSKIATVWCWNPLKILLFARSLKRNCITARVEAIEPNEYEKLNQFLAVFRSLPFDDAAAETYGRIRADLAAKGTPIGPNDLMIAAIAVTHGAILVTHNTREFERVDGLQWEDWET
ncbi:MAG: PIN domain-containing protein [Gammaproteobacteria bacterium]